MGFITDYILVLISSKKEDKKIKAGLEKNNNLSSDVILKVQQMEKRAANGVPDFYYDLGLMFLQEESVGYDPKRAINYFEKGKKVNNFKSSYGAALFYKGYWSYQHRDSYNCYMSYLTASHCVTQLDDFMFNVKKAIEEDFLIESTKKDGIKITLIKDMPIR